MKLRCPKCGFVFDVSYARAVSCAGCPSATLGNCGYVRCPRCGHEFPYSSGFRLR